MQWTKLVTEWFSKESDIFKKLIKKILRRKEENNKHMSGVLKVINVLWINILIIFIYQVQRMLSEYTKNIRRMEERVRESEQQAGEASKQVAMQSIRARQMASERESLLAELARSQR